MTVKVYAHFVADLGSRGLSEFRGIVELGTTLKLCRDSEVIAVELARDFNVEKDRIHVLGWSRLH
jgi:hypothetical protein